MWHRRLKRAGAQSALGAAAGFAAAALRATPGLPAPAPYPVAVSHRHRLLFYGIPKTASATLRWLMLMLDAEDASRLETPRQGLGALPRLRDNGQLLMAFQVPLTRCRSYRRFCFVRNPWDRLVSAFMDKVVKSLRLGRPVPFAEDWPAVDFSRLSFEAFIELACGLRGCRGDFHIRPQSCFIAGREMDFIGRFEHFARDVDALFARFELPPALRARVPKLNVTERCDYTAYYNHATRDLVRNRYFTDISRFKYEFGDSVR